VPALILRIFQGFLQSPRADWTLFFIGAEDYSPVGSLPSRGKWKSGCISKGAGGGMDLESTVRVMARVLFIDDDAEGRKVDGWLSLPPQGFSLIELEKRVIEHVLALTDGNISQAARYLCVPRHILVYRIDKHGISRGPGRSK